MEKNSKKYLDDLNRCTDRLLRSEVFLPLGLELMKRNVIFTEQVPLGAPAATDYKLIFVNPINSFFQTNFLQRFTFVMLHEILHVILKHNQRMGHRDSILWNFACDFMINLLLYHIEIEKGNANSTNLISLNIKDYSNQICFDEQFDNLLEEEIYEIIKKEAKQTKKSHSINYKKFLDSNGVPSDNVDPNAEIQISENEIQFRGKTYRQVSVEFPENKQQIESQSKEGVSEEDLSRAMFQQKILSRGFESATFNKFLGKLFKVKIDWTIFLRDSLLIELQKSNEVSFSKPRLAWLANAYYLPYLPNQTEEEKFGTVVITIDESGSMSDEDITKAIDIVRQSDSYYKNVYVIKHDTSTNWHKIYDKIEAGDIEELLERKHCGGTSHKEVFEHICEFSKTSDTFVSLVICITDMMSDIQECQQILGSIPRIYLVPQEVNESYTENVKGKVITIQT